MNLNKLNLNTVWMTCMICGAIAMSTGNTFAGLAFSGIAFLLSIVSLLV